jgi:DNA replication protein DnaC
MLTLESIEQKYRSLIFNSMAQSLSELIQKAEDNELSYLQFADELVERELDQRNQKRVKHNQKRATFPMLKRLDEFDFRIQSTITKKEVAALLDFTFLDQRENLLFIGPPGVGKTHLSIALGIKAIEAGYKVLFKNAMELIEMLDLAEVQGELKKKISTFAKFDCLIIDELGFLPVNKQGMYNFFQLINHFYEFRSIILTTNKDFTSWNEFFFDENVAVPVVDRLIHHSKIFMLGGESYRLRQKKGQ